MAGLEKTSRAPKGVTVLQTVIVYINILSCFTRYAEILCDGMPAVINGRTGEEY